LQVVVLLLALGVFLPRVPGAIYFAWKLLLAGGSDAVAAVPAATGFEA
jgi:hypothetical protein